MKRKHKNIYIQLGLNIAYYRKRKGLTQEKLAEALEMSRNHISKIEALNVETSLSLDTLFDIAEILDISPSVLLELRD